MPSVSISFKNNFYPTLPLYGLTVILNSDNPAGNIAIMNIINRQFSVIRDCSKTVTVVTNGYEEVLSTRISFGITSISSFQGNLSIEGILDKNNPLKKIFELFPNFFKDFEEG